MTLGATLTQITDEAFAFSPRGHLNDRKTYQLAEN
jgi:hypothetical protein